MPEIKFEPKLMMDGSQWCALIGEDLHTGVAGFGDTPKAAVAALMENLDDNLQN